MAQAPKLIILPGRYYHLFNRGINRCQLFRDTTDYLKFLELIIRYVIPIGNVFSYALMGNHYHLSVQTKTAQQLDPKFLKNVHTLTRTFGHLQNAYALYYNNRHQRVSGLFERSFERREIDSLEYLRNVIVYHNRNPTHHNELVDFREYFWSSYQELSNPTVDSFLNRELIFSKFGGKENFFKKHESEVPNALRLTDFADDL